MESSNGLKYTISTNFSYYRKSNFGNENIAVKTLPKSVIT